MKTFRTNGAAGALLDEYEKALNELLETVKPISQETLTRIFDPETKDPNCVSIQSILSHVIKAGYNYAVVIRKSLGEQVAYQEIRILNTVSQYEAEIKKMFAFNEALFRDYPNLELEQYDSAKKFTVTWGQQYDVEQILEHAIVHILRHRRQIEKFLQL